jgi:hypothetical protein
MTQPKQIRTDAGIAQHVAATMAGVSPHTWKLFEANPDAVSPPKRRACEAAVEKMADLVRAKAAAA